MASTAMALQPQYYTPFSGDLFQRFIDYVDRKDTTVRGYIICLRQFAKWLKAKGIAQPTRDDIKAYRDSMADPARGLAVATQQQYLQAVRYFFRWTSAEGLYPNVADNVRSPQIRHDVHKKDALDDCDTAIIAATIDRSTEAGKRDYAMFVICATFGLRCIEISRADVGDIKTIRGRAYLELQRKGHDEKDKKKWIVPEIKDVLDDYLNTRTDKPTAKSPLFVSTSNHIRKYDKAGNPIPENNQRRMASTTISVIFKKILVNAGYDSDRLTAHSLRHTAGTAAFRVTGDIYTVQKYMDHANPETTEIYVHDIERDEQITEQLVYDYLFKGKSTQPQRAEAGRLLDQLDAAQLDRVIDFIKGIQ